MAKIEKKKLPEKVIDEIRHLLESGQLKIGDKLPNQNILALELGVSRTSLREGMRMLDLLGVIEQRPGYGTVIRRMIPELHTEGRDLALLSDADATFELLEAREIIECGAIRLAAVKATESQIERLFELVKKMSQHLKEDNDQAYRKLDYAFHEFIATAAGNRFLQEPANALSKYVQQFIDENTLLLPGSLKDSQQYHQSMCEAIAERNPDRAEKEMRRHIQTIVTSYKRYQASTRNFKKPTK